MKWIPIDVSATANMPDESTLTTRAAAIETKTKAFSGHFTDLHTAWNGLSGLYQAPAQQQVLTAMNTPKTAAEDIVDSSTSIKNALQDFATAVGDIQAKRTTLVGDIADAKTQFDAILDPQVGRLIRDPLVKRAANLATEYTTAQQTCVTALKAVDRVTTDVTSHYAPGILDLVSNDAERLQRAASGQDSTPAQIRAYYAYLGKMSPDEITTFAKEYPEAMVYGPRNSMPAREQVDFWTGLSPAQQSALITSLPIIAGNTEGATYAQRAESNERVLRMMLDGRFPTTAAQDKAYQAIANSLVAPTASDPDRHLISFDPSTDKPLAGVSIGNVDGASQVTINASGITSKTQGMEGEVENAQALWDAQLPYTGGTHSVIAWIGYDSPGGFPASTEVNYTDKARVGGAELATQLDGMHLTRALNDGNVPRINVGAHSYGTTMAAYALTQTEFDVDSVYFYGSAGLDPQVADSADDLHVKDADNGRPAVYATQAMGDLVAPGGIFSSQFGDVARISPTDDAFGAQVLDAEESVDEYGRPLKATTGHSGHGTYDGQPLSVPHNQVELAKFLFDYAKGEAIGAYDTETGHGYLDRDTTSLHHYARVASGNTSGLEITDQAATDDFVESSTERLNRLMAAPGELVDGGQRTFNSATDGTQSGLNALQDSFVGTANSAFDGGQNLFSSATKGGQSFLSHAANGGFDFVQDHVGLGDNDTIDSLQEGASDAGNGLVDGTRDLANGGLDLVQGGGNTVADGAADLRNFLIDDQQESVNNNIDSGQKLVGVVADSTQRTAEYGLREYSATHRDEPTR
ncbi:hypothetical protein JTF08_09205 [Micrococcaceae bacterium RIT802]|nr:hypothetical protein [Micrococcaceae bacterium RIT 802]